MKSRRKSYVGMGSQQGKPIYSAKFRTWDPLYGYLELSPIEREFVITPEVQRLRHIRLCNIDSLLIPGAAQVSRFEHALGVLRLANEWIQTHEVSANEANDLRIAALVHDMQSGPFGHSIQYILEDNKIGNEFSHEDLAGARDKLFHQDISANVSYQGDHFQVQKSAGKRWKEVADLIAGRGRLGSLISGSIDFDNIDNVVRLAFHAGLCLPGDETLPIQLAKSIIPSSKGIVIPAHAIPYVERWQAIRKKLYNFLLLDWGEFSAKAMLTRAFEEAVELDLLGVDNWKMTDDELINYFLEQVGEGQFIKELSRRLRLGRLFTPILIAKTGSVETYKNLSKIKTKRRIEGKLKHAIYKDKPGPNLLIHFILDVKKTERAIKVIVKETGKAIVIGNDSRCLLIALFASKPITRLEEKELREKAVTSLIKLGCRQIVPVEDPLNPPEAEAERQLKFL